VTGIGYILNPDFSFVKIAAPYAQVQTVYDQLLFPFSVKMLCNTHTSYMLLQELLDIRQRQPTGPQLVQQITKQANDVPHFTWNFYFSFSFQMMFV
jgi:hypothetical protein